MQTANGPGCDSPVAGKAADPDPIALLRDLVDRLQLARHGSPELDLLVTAAYADPAAAVPSRRDACAACCSTDLDDALALLPPGFNFSLGHRDGVFWAWAQPNDSWNPGDGESRHDHPGGSGLVVARTASLAVACAALILRARWLEVA
jgi:hypothetical protein